MSENCRVITMNTTITNLDSSADCILSMTKSGIGSYTCVSNVHMCMETFDSLEFRSVVNKADMIIPDGRPIYWALKLLGAQNAQQVRGQDIMNALCKASVSRKINIGLYGGSSTKILEQVKAQLSKDYPGISISYAHSPPFRRITSTEDAQTINAINSANVNILFVGIGCPKQEYWMSGHKDDLHCTMLGVGAAYDFIAGSKKHAPRWLQIIGLEWFFRLLLEPNRLWKRYLKQNPRFIYHIFCQWILGKKY